MDKLERYVELNIKKKEIEDEMKKLKEELDVKGGEVIKGYKFSLQEKTTYKLKEGIDLETIKKQYPEALKIDTKELYNVSDSPESILEKNVTKYFKLTKASKKDLEGSMPDF